MAKEEDVRDVAIVVEWFAFAWSQHAAPVDTNTCQAT